MTYDMNIVIETERLIMRVPRREDFDGFCALMADEESAKFIGGVMEPPQVWRGMATMAGSWALEGVGMFSVIEKTTGNWIGRVGPWEPHGWPGHEVGWGLLKESWGRGLAMEAAVAAMDYAVEVLGWDDIIHNIHVDNVPSQKLAARLGSTNRGSVRMPAPFHELPIEAWGQTSAQWKTRRR